MSNSKLSVAPTGDQNGRVTLVDGNEGIILKVSTPHLQFSVMD
jgi:hypothetical protein